MSTGFVHPMNVDVCLISRVHSTKPQYATVINTVSESFEPFLEMVVGYAEEIITLDKQCCQQRTNHPTASCPNNIHWVHSLRVTRFLLAVFAMHVCSLWCMAVQRVHWAGDSE
jgi:hypothetical protein